MEDWKSQLNSIKKDMESKMTPEEKQKMYQEREQERKRQLEFNKRKHLLYEFLAGYKYNSGIYINNFMRNRNYEEYCNDKFHSFAFDINGILPNIFDDEVLSFNLVHYIGELEKRNIAYFPIKPGFIERLIALEEAFQYAKKTDSDTILYRGCSTIERNGVNGVVSTTLNKTIAEQFSRGTILTINLPKGSSYIDVKAIRPKEQRRKDKEEEWLLPPCDYEIINEERKSKNNELNNRYNDTLHLTINVKERDFITDLYTQMENMPEEYREYVYPYTQEEFEEAKTIVKKYINKRQ